MPSLDGRRERHTLCAITRTIMIQQVNIHLAPYNRGFHLITEEVLAHLSNLPTMGLLNVFIQHTSAGLTINENADPSVRVDFESVFNKRIMPENESYLTHTLEGSDAVSYTHLTLPTTPYV